MFQGAERAVRVRAHVSGISALRPGRLRARGREALLALLRCGPQRALSRTRMAAAAWCTRLSRIEEGCALTRRDTATHPEFPEPRVGVVQRSRVGIHLMGARSRFVGVRQNDRDYS